jgi:transposase
MCEDVGEKLIYLPLYSPDLNPIEELFAELKGFIRRNWNYYEKDPERGFDGFLEWRINVVGAKEESARGFSACRIEDRTSRRKLLSPSWGQVPHEHSHTSLLIEPRVT